VPGACYRALLLPSERPVVISLCITHTRSGLTVACPAVLQKKAPLALYVRLSRCGSLRQSTLWGALWSVLRVRLRTSCAVPVEAVSWPGNGRMPGLGRCGLSRRAASGRAWGEER